MMLDQPLSDLLSIVFISRRKGKIHAQTPPSAETYQHRGKGVISQVSGLPLGTSCQHLLSMLARGGGNLFAPGHTRDFLDTF
jgi:hypothetical protein